MDPNQTYELFVRTVCLSCDNCAGELTCRRGLFFDTSCGTDCYIDADYDGFPVGIDCDDTNPYINPEVLDMADNQIDENCDGVDNVSTNAKNLLKPKPIVVLPNPVRNAMRVLNTEGIGGIYTLNGQKVLEFDLGEEVDISILVAGSTILGALPSEAKR